MITAAGMVNLVPSLFVSVTAVVTVLTVVLVAKSGKVAMAYGVWYRQAARDYRGLRLGSIGEGVCY